MNKLHSTLLAVCLMSVGQLALADNNMMAPANAISNDSTNSMDKDSMKKMDNPNNMMAPANAMSNDSTNSMDKDSMKKMDKHHKMKAMKKMQPSDTMTPSSTMSQ